MSADLTELLAAAERVLERPRDLEVVPDAVVLATFARDLFTCEDEGTHRVRQTPRTSVVEVLEVAELGASRPHRVIRHVLLFKRNARRLAADLLRAAAQADGGR